MDRVKWMLILTGEVILVLEAECLKTFQVRFVVSMMGLCLFPFGKSRGFFTSAVFSFPLCLCDFLFLVATLNGHSRDFVVPQLLTHDR